MERNAVVVVNTALDAGDSIFALEFAEFCAEWLSRHAKTGMDNAKSLLKRLAPAFEKRGIETEPLVRVCSTERLAKEVNALKPEVVFLTDSKLAKHLKKDIIGLQVEYPNPRKKELRVSAAYGAAAFLLYAAIFTSFGAIKGILTQKSFVSVALILGTVLAVAYIYGNTIAHVLKYLGIKPKAH
ncbi:hypothetical protein [Candidatus Hecatella orcuttiae]|uniref:hypothetical protein n=1 Tax=Candidatus Hecatella orcuttiae TaxID=1935119 RepID=UPI002867C6DE|nr:hypothetical protein [Candidatus Hecatella orcuttiae]